MIRTAAGFTTAIIWVAAASSLANAQDAPTIKLEPGLWKVLTKTSQNGQAMPDKTENRCYSAAEFNDLVKTFATLFADHDCTRSHAFAGKTLTISAACSAPAPQGGALTVKAEGIYVFEDDKRFTSSVTSTFMPPNQPITTFSVTKNAEYFGPCAN
jgi:Protein of unknown function (DUF3617)